MMVELWTRKRVMGDEDENVMEDTSGYDKSGVQVAWLVLEDLISVLLPAGLGLGPAILAMVNWLTHEILSSPSFSWWFPPFPLISLFLGLSSTITEEHKVKSPLSISQCYNHELTPSTAYPNYSIIPRLTVSRSQPVSHILADIAFNSLHTHHYKFTNELSLNRRHASLQTDCLQVLLQSRSIIACKCISKLALSQPRSASLSSLDLGLQVHVQTRSITASKCIFGLLHLALQVNLQTRSITVSQCISKLDWSWPRSISLRSDSGCTQIQG